MVTWLAALATGIAGGLVVDALAKAPKKSLPTILPRPSWLTQPGLDVTPIQFWSAVAGAGIATFVLVYALTSLAVVALMPAVVVATVPRAYFGKRRAQRLAEVQAAWPDGLRDLVSSVRSGASLPMAVENLAAFGPAPLREAFQGFAVYAASLGVVPALEMVKSDLADPTSDRVLEVLVLAHERGGPVVPHILSDLADATTRDIWALEQVRTESLEQKINARIVFVLPWLVLIGMTARSGAFREFYSSPMGMVVVLLGGVLSVVGILVSSRLGRQPAEPRVMVAAGRSG